MPRKAKEQPESDTDSSSSEEVHIKEYNPKRDYEEHSSNILFARRKSGKSHLLAYILSQTYKKYDIGIVISESANRNKFWHKYFPSNLIHTEYSPDLIKLLYARLDRKINEGEPETAIVILDDCISEKGFHEDKMVKSLFSASRHAGVTVFLTTQYPSAVPPLVRKNADRAFIFKTVGNQEITMLSDSYAIGHHKDDFIEVLEANTENYSCLVCNLYLNTSDPSRYFQHITAPAKVKKFTMFS